MDIKAELFALADEKNAGFQYKLTPGIERPRFLGARMPQIRALAKRALKDGSCNAFLDTLPHYYFDENMLHGVMISGIKDFDECVKRVEAFLPYVDNWAVCDSMSPAVFAKNKAAALLLAREWIASPHTYTCRFGIAVLMRHFLDEDFSKEYISLVAAVRSDEYYVNMMAAWYFATALAKQWEQTVPFLENKTLGAWTHNKAIQKACESFRVSGAQKEYLKTLKIKP